MSEITRDEALAEMHRIQDTLSQTDRDIFDVCLGVLLICAGNERAAQLEARVGVLEEANKTLHQHVTFYHRWATADVLIEGHKPAEIERSNYGVMRHYPLTYAEIEALAGKAAP
jgi:hypothetical protein